MRFDEKIKKAIACDSVGKPESVLGRAVCLSVHPGKMLLFPFLHWFNKHYRNKYAFARIMFGFDLVLIGSLIGLACALLIANIYSPARFATRVTLEATVAPREVIAGASSTLVIQLTNGTNEIIRNARLRLSYPDHFLLQELVAEGQPVEGETIELGDIPVGDSRSVHVRGVMFGDVAGEQSFTSTLNFVHGKNRDIPVSKTDVYTFSPVASTLEIALVLPHTLIAFQPMEGTITYHNRGEIDFPTISIEPQWPAGFTLQSTSTPFVDGAFRLPALTAGREGSMDFTGYLDDVGDEVTFVFLPSFTFGKSRYHQETLTHTAPVVPPQIKIEHRVTKTSVQPGAQTQFTIRYENIGEFAVNDVALAIESDSQFFSKKMYEVGSASYPELAKIQPGESGEVIMQVPLRSSILQSETDIYENLDLTTRALASYTLGDGTGQRVTSKGSSLSSPITSPVVLESFGRYSTATGDQLGRGPLPPRVGIETKYWVFWHVDGTINDLENVKVEGALAEGVTFTGRQTSSQNSGVEWDEEDGTISWSAVLVEPTLSPMSKIIGVAFEVSLTPTSAMVGSSPTLIDQIRLTASDARTGAFVSASGLPVSTNLPQDLLATGKAAVSPP
jgi:hypothetical protein